MTLLAPHLTAYLRERLPQERQASRHTVDAYTYTFKLLFAFTTKRLGVPPSALALEQLDAPLLLEFLAHLQTERGTGARTRNARLVALKSFLRFVEYRVPSAPEQVRRVSGLHVQGVAVDLRVHGDRGDAELLAGADHANGDLAAVGDEDLLEHAAAKGTCVWRCKTCLLYTSPSPRDRTRSRMPSSA